MRFSVSVLCITLVVAAAAPARSEPSGPIGTAVAVVDLVTAQLARETRTLAVGDDVRQYEIIEVGTNASSELRLNDDTKLALGAGSRLVLDKFVYDPEQSGGSIFLNLAKGTFRFITGLAAKPAYVVRVPGASITVRGTIFDVFVEDSGASWLLLQEGGVRICNVRGSCRNHSEVGKIVPISDQGDVGRASRWASLPGLQKVAFDNAFPFVVNAPSIDPQTLLTREEIVGDASPGPEPQKDASDSESESPPKVNKPAKKVVDVDEPDVPERRRGGKAIGYAATYVPALIDRIRDRANDDDDDDFYENSISPGGMFGHGHGKGYVPN